MLRKEQRNSIIEICPVRNVIARFGNKWALDIDFKRTRENPFQRTASVNSRYIITGIVGHIKDTRNRCPCSPYNLSDCSSKSRISTDGIRAVARTYHNPTDRMGTDKLENNSHAPKRVRGKASGRIGSIFQKEYQLSSCRL